MAKLLIADDEPRSSKLLTRMLQAGGDYEIRACENGEKCVKLASTFKPDIIILDIMMPDMDGFEVLRQLKENNRTARIPVIMLTGRTDQEALEKSMYWYAEQYLTKPVAMEDINKAVTNALARRASFGEKGQDGQAGSTRRV